MAGVNKITKRIPAEKFELFIKKRARANASLLNSLNLKIINAEKELKILKRKVTELKNKEGKLTLVDCKLAQLKYEDLRKKLKDAYVLVDEMKDHKSESIFNILLYYSN